MRKVITLCHTTTAWAIHANGMNLINIGQGVEFIGQITNRLNRAEIPIHRIDRFECDQFRRRGIICRQQFTQMRNIIVAEHTLGPAIAAHTLDHGGVVQFV